MKKVLGVLLAILICIPTIAFAATSLIEIDDVEKAFNNSRTVSSYDTLLGLKTTMKVNKDDNTIDFYNENKKISTISYTNEYIEMDNRDFIPTEDNISVVLYQSIHMLGLTNAIIELSGFENKTIEDNAKPNDFEKYGMIVETEKKSYEEDNDGATVTTTVEYIKYLKISLDKEKIKKLVEEYGADLTEFSNPFIDDFKPKLTATNVTSNSITLLVDIEKDNVSSTYSVYADIYRSTSENGIFVKVSSTPIDFTKENATFTDKNLDANKTYYYKAIITDENVESSIISVTTKQSYINEDVSNPKTGVTSPIILIPVTIIFATLYFIIKKKSIFKNI